MGCVLGCSSDRNSAAWPICVWVIAETYLLAETKGKSMDRSWWGYCANLSLDITDFDNVNGTDGIW